MISIGSVSCYWFKKKHFSNRFTSKYSENRCPEHNDFFAVNNLNFYKLVAFKTIPCVLKQSPE